MWTTYANTIKREISESLRKLNLSSEQTADLIFRKNMEAEKLRRSIKEEHKRLKRIEQQIEQATVEQEHARIIGNQPILDTNEFAINIGDTIEIKNGYSNFSANFPKLRRSQAPKCRQSLMTDYHSDKFGKLTHLERTKHCRRKIHKLRIITDSGFDI